MLVMPFMKVWKEGSKSDWRLTGEKVRASDEAVVKRWSRNWFEVETRLGHTEDRYEVIKDGVKIYQEWHRRSPATREYTQQQAMDLYINNGFANNHLYEGFTRQPADGNEELFVIIGQRPL
jgi:hypothetical protein